jgi:replicative DNA helicase
MSNFPNNRNNRPPVVIADMFNKAPPDAPKAEQNCLSAMMMGEDGAADAIAILGENGDPFTVPGNAAVYEAIVKCYRARKGVEISIVAQCLRDSKMYDAIGGTDFMMEFHERVPGWSGAHYYAKIVAEKHAIRKVINAAGLILDTAYNSGQTAEEIAAASAGHIFAACAKQADESAEDLSTIIFRACDDMMRTDPDASGLSTGFRAIDDVIGGLRPGELIIIGARPSMGKTAISTAIACNVAKIVPTAFFSLEMGREQIARRILSAQAKVADRAGYRSAKDNESLTATTGEISQNMQMIIDDKAGMTCSGLSIKCRRMVERRGVKCIFIDYLQLLREPGHKARHEEVATMSRMLKELARELKVPIICLAQLNRNVTDRSDNKPRMSDLRESGSCEQDADIVALLHREEYYHKGDEAWLANNPSLVGLAEVIVDKNRNGPTGVAELQWKAAWTAFEEQAKSY